MFLTKFLIILCWICVVAPSDINVEIHPNLITNIISEKFVSFNIESNYIFDSKGFLKSDKLECISNSLSPAYLRIKGPSTDNSLLENTIFKKKGLKKQNLMKKHQVDKGEFNFEQLGLFLDWTQSSNFTPFVVVNNHDRNTNREWNSKMTIRALSIADALEVGDSIWQLNNDCKSVQLSKYIEDLKTFDSILETFDMVKNDKWMISAGDISQCLGDDPKNELKELLSSNDNMIEAMVMNNDSLLETLDELNEENPDLFGDVILYKTVEDDDALADDVKAVNWLNTLGVAAFNGYAAVFRNLNDDFSAPSLTYYSSLLYKKLVGRRVLYISESDAGKDVSVFAHCATLSGGPVPGGVTIFGTNSASEKKSVSVNLVVDDENSEIMQYVLYLNDEGKIVINENVMTNEDDLQPVLQKVTPFKTLTVVLPPKSIGFWVVSNTNVNLCALDEEFVENLFNKLNDDSQLYDTLTQNPETQSDDVTRNRRNSDHRQNEMFLSRKLIDFEEYDRDTAESNFDIVAVNKASENMDINKHFIDAVHLDTDEINVVVSDKNRDNKINDLKDLFNILGQLASLIQLQEEFLDISSDVFKSPFSQAFMDQESINALSNDAKTISEMVPSNAEPEVIRVARSIDPNEVNNERDTNGPDENIDNNGKEVDPIARLIREADSNACIDLVENSQRDRMNIILNKLRNRKPFTLSLDNILPNVQSAQPEETENVGLQSEDVPIVSLPQDTEENDETQPADELNPDNVLDAISDSMNADDDEDEQVVGAELTDDEDLDLSAGKPFIVDPTYVSEQNESVDEHVDDKIEDEPEQPKPIIKFPTLPPRPKVVKPKQSGRPIPNLQKVDNSKSMNNLVRKAHNLLVKVDPKATDDETLESKILEDRVGAPSPLLPVIYRDQLAAQLHRNRLRMQELRNRIQLKLADLRTRQFLDMNLHRLRKRSIDFDPKVKPHKVVKKTMKNYLNLKKSPKGMKIMKKVINGEKNLNLAVDQDSSPRKKRMISNDIDGDVYELDEIKLLNNGKETNELGSPLPESFTSVTFKTTSEATTKISMMGTEEKKYETISNEIIKQDPESSEECHTIKVVAKSYSRKDKSQNEDVSLVGIDKNVDLTINWLDEIIENLRKFVTNVQKKLEESWVLKNLYS